jgi:hypothetical protein
VLKFFPLLHKKIAYTVQKILILYEVINRFLYNSKKSIKELVQLGSNPTQCAKDCGPLHTIREGILACCFLTGLSRILMFVP